MCGIAGEACFDLSASSPDLSAVARYIRSKPLFRRDAAPLGPLGDFPAGMQQ